MFSPICPFFSHHLSTTLYGKSAVDVREFPNVPDLSLGDTDEGVRLRGLTAALVEFNSETWKAKKDAGLSLNSPIEGVDVPSVLSEMQDALNAMHKLE